VARGESPSIVLAANADLRVARRGLNRQHTISLAAPPVTVGRGASATAGLSPLANSTGTSRLRRHGELR
jgi:hypothetical protein